MFHDRSLLGRCFRGFVLPVLEYCSAVWCLAADTHLKLVDRVVSGARFLTGVCLSVTLLIVDLRLYCVFCIRSGVTPCTLVMVLYLCRMCQSGFTRCSGRKSVYLCASSLQRIAVPQDLNFLLSVPQCSCGTLAAFKIRANAFLFAYKQLYPFLSSTIFPFLFFHSIFWFCEAGEFGWIGCRSLSILIF